LHGRVGAGSDEQGLSDKIKTVYMSILLILHNFQGIASAGFSIFIKQISFKLMVANGNVRRMQYRTAAPEFFMDHILPTIVCCISCLL
jgi:hypothetical protein